MLNFFKKGRRIIFELNVPSFNRSCNKSRIINIRSGNLPSTWAWSKHLSMLNFFKKKRKGKGNLLFPDIVSRRSISTELKSIGKPYYTYRHARGRWFGEDTVQVRHDAAYAPCARLRHRSLEVRRRTWRSTSGGARTRRFCPAIRRVNRPPPSLQRSLSASSLVEMRGKSIVLRILSPSCLLLFSISVFTRWLGKVTAMTIDYWNLGKEKNNFEY